MTIRPAICLAMAHVKDEGAKEEPDSKMEIETMSQIPEPAHALQLPLAITEENFQDVVLSACKHHLDLCGGPVQYLKKHLGPEANSKWSDFAEALSNAFPRRSDMSYLDDQILPRHLPEGQASMMCFFTCTYFQAAASSRGILDPLSCYCFASAGKIWMGPRRGPRLDASRGRPKGLDKC